MATHKPMGLIKGATLPQPPSLRARDGERQTRREMPYRIDRVVVASLEVRTRPLLSRSDDLPLRLASRRLDFRERVARF